MVGFSLLAENDASLPQISVRSDYFFSPLVYTSFICHETDSALLKPLPRAVELLDMVSAQKTH